MWVRAGGQSLWPLVLDADQLLVERGAEHELARGDIGLIVDHRGQLVAHLVEQVHPLVTVSSVGVPDAPAKEVLGKIVGLRRKGVTVRFPRGSRLLLRQVPRAAKLLKRVVLLRAFVHLMRDRSK
jgi:hypothetical protein